MRSKSTIKNIALWGTSASGQMCADQIKSYELNLKVVVNSQKISGEKFGGINVIYVNELTSEDLNGIDLVVLAFHGSTDKERQIVQSVGYSGLVFQFVAGSNLEKVLKGQINLKKVSESVEDLKQLISVVICQINMSNTVFVIADEKGSEQFVIIQDLYKNKAPIISINLNDVGTSLPNDYQLTLQELSKFSHSTSANVVVLSDNYVQIQRSKALLRRANIDKVSDLWMLFDNIPVNELPEHVFLFPESFHIYPIDIPDFFVNPGVDFLLLDPPPRFLGVMPNGLGYVHNILEKTGINFQTIDLDIIFYHRFHGARILDDMIEERVNGFSMPYDPWAAEFIEEVWAKPDIIEYFKPELEELIEQISLVQPKMVGLSLHSTNLPAANYLAKRIRMVSPSTSIIVGGYDCIDYETGPKVFQEYDYMVIFEAEKSLPELVKRIMNNTPADGLPGIVVKKTHGLFPFVPAEQLINLDDVPFPKYQWIDIHLYCNWNGYQITPIMLSRGCRWSKCTFCGERFDWRKRSVANLVDEIEWLRGQGCNLFLFNDSDLSGDPKLVGAVCQEIIDRGISDVKFAGQLRVQKGYTQDYFHLLKKAGFTALRYGVDAWSKNTLKLQKKGYTLKMIEDVLSFTKNSGIYTTINLVIGIPGETEKDFEETLANMVKHKSLFHQIENIHAFVLTKRSVYWEELDKHPIKLTQTEEDLEKHPLVIPEEAWYSTDPYIDKEVRRKRVEMLVNSALQSGISLGGYADWKSNQIIEDKSKEI